MVTVEQTVACSPNVVVAVPTIRSFRSGCMLDVEVVCRQGTLSEDDWRDLRMSVHGAYSGSQGTMHGRELGFSGFGLWLWLPPPAEAFEFAVEWPFGGIELIMAELDGAATVAAAGR